MDHELDDACHRIHVTTVFYLHSPYECALRMSGIGSCILLAESIFQVINLVLLLILLIERWMEKSSYTVGSQQEEDKDAVKESLHFSNEK